jgi:hypothetical protein
VLSGLDLKLRSLAAGLVLATLQAGCGLMEPRTERYVAPAVGSTFTSIRRDTGSFGSATAMLPGKYLGEVTWRGQKVHAFETPELTTYATTGDRFAFIAQVKGDRPLFSWDPPAAWELPLEVGKKWTRKYRLTIHAANRTIAVEEAQVIEAFEDLTTPAGTFKAWRVRSADNFGNENVQWYAPDLGVFVKQSLRRTAKNPSGPGTREIELVSYTRGGN